ncbi:YALIA101S04e15258g1_1 [Yarrowia lipolytica]|nr:YALIA101S04e15258g1_1 [Yarrowia lipolytica]
MSVTKRLVPFTGFINSRARQAFSDIPKMEAMLKSSGLQKFYRKSDNLTIVDAYAGYGWFSTALYNSLQPKKLFLMDPSNYSKEPLSHLQAQDPEVITYSNYDPFQWRSYYPVYESISKTYNKPDRTEVSRDFLFVANLAYTRGESLLYQYLLCILHQNWLQRYGRVRMLIWISSASAEKLTHGSRRTKLQDKTVALKELDERIDKLKANIAKSELWLKRPNLSEKSENSHNKKLDKYRNTLEKLEKKRAESVSLIENRRFKSTVIREMTCDYRYLIGGNAKHTKRSKPVTTEAHRQVQIKKRLEGHKKRVPQMTCNPYDKDALVYYENDYENMFCPQKTTSLGGLVLLELTPKNVKLERLDEWFFVVTRLFVASILPIGRTLETLGPGATEWMSPHLSPAILSSKISEISIPDLEHIVEVFWRWPFKPQVLIDTYEERMVSTPDESTFDNPLFDIDDDVEGGGSDVDDDLM